MAGDEYNSGDTRKAKDDRTPDDKSDASLVARVRRRKCVMFDADETNRDLALEDIRFLHEPGAQWDKTQRDIRGERPCYEFNELRVKALRVINDMRANRPQGKVRAVEDSDKPTADTREGLIRNIWNISDGDSVTDYAADYQVSGGMGAWRVETVWSDDTTWQQDIRVRPFKNPFCVWRDPSVSDQLGLDARDWLISEKMPKAAYDERWPDIAPVSFDDGDDQFDDDDTDWYGTDGVRVCEYWWKEPTSKTIALLSDGKTVEIKEAKRGDTRGSTLADGSPLPLDPATGQAVTIKRRRTVKSHKIMMCIVSGNAVLEPPTEWPGKYFPFVQVFGEWRVIGGKVVWHGFTRFSKDAQRMANVTMTAIAESVMSAPMSHFWATPKQAEGHVEKWKEAHKKLIPYLPYNPDPVANNGGPPQRMNPADVPVALMEMRGISADLLKGTSGVFDASLGNQTNETSGRAIRARQAQGEIATFNYSDNMSKGVRLTWIIVDDLVSKVYTAEQSVRILGPDLAEKYVKVNSVQPDPKNPGQMRKVNDLTVGKYDVTMTVGPSFATQRQEATELYTQLGQAVPQVWGVAGDIIAKSMDLPYSDQLAERLRTLLPPAIQKQLQEGKDLPPEVTQAMTQAEGMLQQAQQMAQASQEAMTAAKEATAQAKSAGADVQVKIANLKAEEAKLAADVAKFQTSIAEQALLASQQGVSDEFRQQMADALASIQEQATSLFTQYAEQLNATHAQAIASTAAQTRKRGVKLARQPDGSFHGEIVDSPADSEGPSDPPGDSEGAGDMPPPGAPPAAPPMQATA
jgi:hypothetical protein